MRHLVQYSTGLASAELAWRLVDQYGAGNVHLLTADTRVEDADNWRFAHEVHGRLACEWTVLADGRTPMEVGRAKRVVPNNRLAVCSRILKRELLRKHIDACYDPSDTVIYLGYDWTETDRAQRALPHWVPFRALAPLTEPPYVDKPDLCATFRGRGIEPPRLYGQGFAHANCGGACVRGGQAQWELLLRVNRPRFLAWEAEEQRTRTELGKNVAILKDRRNGQSRPLPLREFRERVEARPELFDSTDWGACGCVEG